MPQQNCKLLKNDDMLFSILQAGGAVDAVEAVASPQVETYTLIELAA